MNHHLSTRTWLYKYREIKSLLMEEKTPFSVASLTDTGALGRLVANQREVMTRLLELLYVLNIKRNIF